MIFRTERVNCILFLVLVLFSVCAKWYLNLLGSGAKFGAIVVAFVFIWLVIFWFNVGVCVCV